MPPPDTHAVTLCCPACGECSEIALDLISPGMNLDWQCPECKTQFVIRIEFEPQEMRQDAVA